MLNWNCDRENWRANTSHLIEARKLQSASDCRRSESGWISSEERHTGASPGKSPGKQCALTVRSHGKNPRSPSNQMAAELPRDSTVSTRTIFSRLLKKPSLRARCAAASAAVFMNPHFLSEGADLFGHYCSCSWHLLMAFRNVNKCFRLILLVYLLPFIG